MKSPRRHITFGIVVGEVSGDALGGKLIPALRTRFPQDHLEFIGTAGPTLTAQGMISLFPLSEIAVMGIVPVIKKLPSLLRRIRQTADALIASKPDCLILIDSPDFTHRVAKRVRAVLPDIPIIDYVSPSVWAWRPGRAKKMRAYIDHVLALLPFEPDAHQRLGGPSCTYVGHPLIERLDELHPTKADQMRRDTKPPLVLVLPGSRRSEITRLMPIFRDTIKLVAEQSRENLEFALPVVDHVRPQVEAAMANWPIKPSLIFGEAEKFSAFRRATAALAASGTVTLELALAQVPMAVGYRVGTVEGQIRHFIHVSSIVLANLIIGENVIPERIQSDCNPEHLAADLLPLLSATPQRQKQLNGFVKLDKVMTIGQSSPSQKAANIIANYIKK
jgi:lipid-A-disaccharide synthase